MTSDPLAMPVQFLKGVGPERAKALGELGIRTVDDLLHALPSRHLDRSTVVPISAAQEGVRQTFQGTIEEVSERLTRRRIGIVEVRLCDESGALPVRFFNQAYLKRTLKPGDTMVVTGTLSRDYGVHLQPAEFEVLPDEEDEPIHAAGFVPSYRLPKRFTQKAFRRLMHGVVEQHAGVVPEVLGAELRRRRGLCSATEAIRNAHFPADAAQLERARSRLAYEELFLLQVTMAMRRAGRHELAAGARVRVSKAVDFRIRSLFPFALTRAQERVIAELKTDLASGHPMNRLLQGDVGSGKTIVAAYAVLAAIAAKGQAAVLAPTEILAEQHLRTFTSLLGHSKVRIGFFGGSRKSDRARAAESLASGGIELAIGTHALLEPGIRFKNLILGVIDEQQKFGVRQRSALRQKGRHPHVLVMTATPIPRTLALTLYGDLDVSVLDEMPPGRRPVRTLFRPRSKRAQVWELVRSKIREGRQAYVVAPLIDESEKLDLAAAVELHRELTEAFKEIAVGLLHGRLSSDEKDRIMEEFRAGKIQVLVSTVVIEVGIDVPNATVMVIEQGERFGLSQLHQLRGRVGRGSLESHCIVMAEFMTERLKAFTSTTDGFKLAEEDLRIRGAGEVLGTRQSGLPELQAADLLRDTKLLGWARDDARKLVQADPALTRSPGPLIRRILKERWGLNSSFSVVG